MGLFDKERPGEARFYGPEEVAAVRERAKELEIQAQLQKDLMEEKRIEQARRKEQKAQEKEANAHKREQQKQARIIQKNLLIQQREERKAEALIRKQIQQGPARSFEKGCPGAAAERTCNGARYHSSAED